MATVTRDGWSVSTMSGSQVKGVVLGVTKHRTINGRWVMQRGDGDGRRFASSDAAHAWAAEHGYLMEYVRRVWCPHCRVLHTFMGRGSSFCDVRGKFIGG